MADNKKSLHEEAMYLLERINTELKGSKYLATLNTKMIGVVKDLNEVRVAIITGTEQSDNKVSEYNHD